MPRHAFLALSALAISTMAQSAMAADMLADESGYRPQVVYTQTAYAYEVCDDLLLVYRAPREPRREVVRVCHPPVAGQ